MLSDENTSRYTAIVGEVLEIDDITLGTEKSGYLVRYRGHLKGDSTQAYASLAEDLKPFDITPLFRNEADLEAGKKKKSHPPTQAQAQAQTGLEIEPAKIGRDVVLLEPWVVKPQPSNPWINLVLFILTAFSVVFAGAMWFSDVPINSLREFPHALWLSLPAGLAFGSCMLAILLAHEFGHYLAARFHHTQVSLPYYIPLPISPFGTMGAFIRLKEPPRNKRTLLDIGIAGPIAGLVVAVPVLIYGLSLSHIEPINVPPGQGLFLEGNSLLYLISKFLVFGRLLPTPSSYQGVAPLLYWLRFIFTGRPLPFGGMDVIISPVAWAGWAGLLITALNLIPAGQLDGGHLIYVLTGKKARYLLPFILGGLFLLGFAWSGWWLWAVLILVLGRVYAEPLDQITALDPPRRLLALAGVLLFILVFTPVPMIQAIASG